MSSSSAKALFRKHLPRIVWSY